MPTKYSEVLCPQVIYVFRICDEAHKGCLKVGMSKLTGDSIDLTNLPANCETLNAIAKERIDSYTATAAIPYDLLHTECSLFFSSKGVGAFDDHQVHEVLLRSGIKKKEFSFSDKAKEWFITDLQTVKNAIEAAKQGRKSLLASEISTDMSPIEFRPEQKSAIERSVKMFQVPGTRMLWNCKMRFGKTLSALQVIKEMRFQKSIIVTHRPVVDDGWYTDFGKIFYDYPNYKYGSRDRGEDFFDLIEGDDPFVYFASLQFLRNNSDTSTRELREAILECKWDLLIVDEAHEGTQTNLGQDVLKKLNRKRTCSIELSGTPFNIVGRYDPSEIVSWTYVDEQREKERWEKENPCDYNPYGGLPHMNMTIYDLNEKFDNYQSRYGDIQFNFREFFRVWTGNPYKDFRRMPDNAVIGRFIHEDDVKAFLDLLVNPDVDTNYPFSTEAYRNIFKHTFWVVPGVAEAAALSLMLRQHPVFSQFKVVNVAGVGDEDSEEKKKEALDSVKDAIENNDYTITLSCGRLTTGVSIPEWTAVFMLYGATSTKAQGYMQTIFRVQTPAIIDGKRKEECYVFDFAPDRIITAIDETVRAASYAKNGKPGTQKATITEEEREEFSAFLHYCSVVSLEGSQMRPYDVTKLLEHLKRVQIERVVRNGFEDSALYNNDLLMNLDSSAINELNDIKGIIGSSPAQGPSGDFVVNDHGFDREDEPDTTPVSVRRGRSLTPEEIEERRERARKKKQKQDAISILRGISIRLPMLIYGADVKDEETGITLENFTSFIDKESWAEFMPPGITMQKFYALRKYYDPDVFKACSKRIRERVRAADCLPPHERIKHIEDILSTFRNPDKETVITPWRVVNLHLSDTIGGYDFFDEDHLFLTESPRYVDRGRVTYRIFEKEDPHILEINSKSGRYPLYIAYSLYREKLKQYISIGLIEDPKNPTIEELQTVWDDVVSLNLYVLCKTPMAEKITRRTLVGYRMVNGIKTRYVEDLLDKITNERESFIAKIRQNKFWHANKNSMIQFDAIIGNPPYQEMLGGTKTGAVPVFNKFVDVAREIKPSYLSMIIPARWMTGGRGLDAFRQTMIGDKQFVKIYDYPDATECFRNVDIKGGVCYFLWESGYNGKCENHLRYHGNEIVSERYLKEDEDDVFIRDPRMLSIKRKARRFNQPTFDSIVSTVRPYGFRGDIFKDPKKHGLPEMFDSSEGLKYAILGLDEANHRVYKYVSEDFPIPRTSLLDDWKIFITRNYGNGVPGELPANPVIAGPGVMCTETFLQIGPFKSEEEAENCMSYMRTKFFRILVAARKQDQSAYRDVYGYVPLQDFSKTWTDAELFSIYGISPEEQKNIDDIFSIRAGEPDSSTEGEADEGEDIE